MFPQGVRCFAYSHSLEVVATGSLDHTVRLWTPFSPQQPVACLFNHTTGVVGVAIFEQSQHLFSLARDLVSYEICVWISKLCYTVTVCVGHTRAHHAPECLGQVPLHSETA